MQDPCFHLTFGESVFNNLEKLEVGVKLGKRGVEEYEYDLPTKENLVNQLAQTGKNYMLHLKNCKLYGQVRSGLG